MNSMYVKTILTDDVRDSMRISLSVQPKKLSPDPVCDFCGDAEPMFVYRATKMSTGHIQDCWRWCACEACSKAVDADNWAYIEDKLETRLAAMMKLMMGRKPDKSMVSQVIKHSLKQFHEAAVRQ